MRRTRPGECARESRPRSLVPLVAAFAIGCGGSAKSADKDGAAPKDEDACTGVIVGDRVSIETEEDIPMPLFAGRWREHVLVVLANEPQANPAQTRILELDGEGALVPGGNWLISPRSDASFGLMDAAVAGNSLALLDVLIDDDGLLLQLGIFELNERRAIGEWVTVPTTTDGRGIPNLFLSDRVLPIEGGWLVVWAVNDPGPPRVQRGFAQRYSPTGERMGEAIPLDEENRGFKHVTSDGKRAIVAVGPDDDPRLLFVDADGVTSVTAPTGTSRLSMIRGNLVATGYDAWILDAAGTPVAGPLGRQVTAVGALGSGYVAFDQSEPGQSFVQALDRHLFPSGPAQEFFLPGLTLPIPPITGKDSTLMLFVAPFESAHLTCAH